MPVLADTLCSEHHVISGFEEPSHAKLVQRAGEVEEQALRDRFEWAESPAQRLSARSEAIGRLVNVAVVCKQA